MRIFCYLINSEFSSQKGINQLFLWKSCEKWLILHDENALFKGAVFARIQDGRKWRIICELLEGMKYADNKENKEVTETQNPAFDYEKAWHLRNN